MKILSYNLFTIQKITPKVENNHYKDTSWTDTIDGKEVTITIQEIEDYLDSKNVNIIEIPVNEVFTMCAHKDKTDSETLKRSEQSDLSFPIIVAKGLDGKWSMILDGHHRLLKAHNQGEEMIKARVLDLMTAPKEYQKMFS
jgi:hypothetical protein